MSYVFGKQIYHRKTKDLRKEISIKIAIIAKLTCFVFQENRKNL